MAYQGPLSRQRSLKLAIVDDELVLNVDTSRLLPQMSPFAERAGEKLRAASCSACRAGIDSISGACSKTQTSVRATRQICTVSNTPGR